MATYECENCGTTAGIDDAIRSEPYGDLDTDRWQTLCCPECGARLKTVFVPDHE